MTLLIGEDLERLFTTFAHTAYRLEVRERYGVGYETVPVRQFLAGEPVDLSYMERWLALMTALTNDGKRIERVRVVSQPFSDYTRYGLWLCDRNVKAGEDIRYLDRQRAGDLPNHDYWLFDSSRLFLMHFDETDDLLGAELVEDPTVVVQHCLWRDAAWHYATPYVEYLKVAGRAVEHPAGT
jgi:hypothetical protein